MASERKAKYVGLALTAIMVVGVGVLCILRWDKWFVQPEEEAYTLPDEPCRVVLTFGNEGENFRMVSWQCGDAVKDSWVEYYEADTIVSDSLLNTDLIKKIKAEGEVFVSRASRGAYYRAEIEDVKANTKYVYRAVTDGKASEWYEYDNANMNPEEVDFVFIGDVQEKTENETNRYIREVFRKNATAQFLVCGGDLAERPRDSDWELAFGVLDSIRTSKPVLAITGNHEYLKSIPRKLERRFSLVFPYFLKSMIGENQLYTIRIGETQLFFLDSNREIQYLLTQRRWLQEELEKSEAKWKIVCLHHPLYSMRGNHNLLQRWVFAGVIEENKVDLVLQGHEHNYARMSKSGTSPLYTISHCSPKTYSHKSLDRFETVYLDSRFYQTVRTSGDTLFCSAYELYDNRLIDSVQIIKQEPASRVETIINISNK